MSAVDLDAAYGECGRIVRASGSSFHQAFRLLPALRRRSLEALYAYCRVVDDAADGSGEAAVNGREAAVNGNEAAVNGNEAAVNGNEAAVNGNEAAVNGNAAAYGHAATHTGDAAAALAFWRDELGRVLAGTPTHPVGVALADSVRRFAIPPQHLGEILDGVAMDLVPQRFETFAELRRYCYHVAAAVGLATIPIFGCRDPRSRDYAEALGIALQLTNIVRDVAEDAERGRIYLPQEDLRRFGYTERDLVTHARNDAFRALIAFECTRAREFYAAARGALTPTDQRALAPAEGMRLVYQRVLAKIAARPEAVFGPQVRLPRWQKLALAGCAWLRTRMPRGTAALATRQESPA